MEKISLTLIAVIAMVQFSFAQWTPNGNNIYNTNTGNVGIGTSTPAYQLTTAGQSNQVAAFAVDAAVTTTSYASFSNRVYFGYNGADQNAFIQGMYGKGIEFNVNSQTIGAGIAAMRITSTGLVGINNTAPIGTLHINGTFMTGGNSGNLSPGTGGAIVSNLYNSGQMLIGYNRTGGNSETDFMANGFSNLGGFAFYSYDNTNSEKQLMWIRGDGNVGIGVAPNTTYKLGVSGAIHAQQINVDMNGWNDYVFNESYHLRPLSEVKVYVDLNHHLPEIPSEKEIVTNGLNLGDIDRLLTKKVEELTLYLIEKDKQIDDAKGIVNKEQTRIDSQERQLESQQQQIDALKRQMQTLVDAASKAKSAN